MAMDKHPGLLGAASGVAQLGIILPLQHYGSRRPQPPEERLMSAVLQDAVDCVEKYRGASDARGQRLFDEAARWLLAMESDWPYSFECICGALDLDLDAVRQRLRIAPTAPTPRPLATEGPRSGKAPKSRLKGVGRLAANPTNG